VGINIWEIFKYELSHNSNMKHHTSFGSTMIFVFIVFSLTLSMTMEFDDTNELGERSRTNKFFDKGMDREKDLRTNIQSNLGSSSESITKTNLGNAGCVDTDGNINYDERGTRTINAVSKTDTCTDSTGVFTTSQSAYLKEYYCVGDEVYECPNSCLQGKCITNLQPFCNDTDGGINGVDFGVVTTEDGSFDDYCSAANDAVNEYSCSGTDVIISYLPCTNSVCENGACLNNGTGGNQDFCNDTDGGIIPFYFGIVTTQDGSFDDTCMDNSTLEEYYCENDLKLLANVACNNGCLNGVCLNESAGGNQNFCNDTDGGLEYYDFGIVTTESNSFNDTCYGDSLQEYYCLNNTQLSNTNVCPNGCENGICLNETTTTTYCEDTDYGPNEYVWGATITNINTLNDTCLSNNSLLEYTCSGTQRVSQTIGCEFGCEFSVCLHGCVDSDGSNKYTRGTVTTNLFVYNDSCSNDDVTEYSCMGEYMSSTGLSCDGLGCDNGACNELTVISVAAGGFHTCALKNDGNVHCWGHADNGQSDDYYGGDAIAVSTGKVHSCVLKSNGNVHCWGDNNWGGTDYGQADDYYGGDAISVSAGKYHTCALKSNGNVHCWGKNDYGQAADFNGGIAVKLSSGDYHNCIIQNDTLVYCWGRDDYGQSRYQMGTPAATSVSAGGHHSCRTRSASTYINCYGLNDDGQSENFFAHTISEVSLGTYHTCVLKTNGAVVCYGNDFYGQSHSYPYKNAIGVSAGYHHTCILKENGSVYCWGDNFYGQSEGYSC